MDIASVVIAQVKNQCIVIDSIIMHPQQEVVEVSVAHRTHMDISDPAFPVFFDPRFAIVFPLLVLQILERHQRHCVDFDVELLPRPVEGQFHFIFLQRRGEILLPIDGRDDTDAVDSDQSVALLDVDLYFVGCGPRKDACHGIRILVVEENARDDGMDPRLGPLFKPHGIESQMRGVELTQHVGHQRP